MFDDISPDDLEYVGKKAGRPDMVEKLTGEATFVSDMELPGMLHVQLKKSPHARARIKGIDVSKATLEVTFSDSVGTQTLDNNEDGLKSLLAQLKARESRLAVVLMEAGAAKARGIKPLARLVSYAHAGVEPEYMGIGPVPASRLALQKAGLTMADIDVIEANEAFAAQACAVAHDLQFDPAKLNPNGSGIGLGHPIGATGNILTVKAVHELQRTGGKRALVTMCIGAGQGIAAIFERM